MYCDTLLQQTDSAFLIFSPNSPKHINNEGEAVPLKVSLRPVIGHIHLVFGPFSFTTLKSVFLSYLVGLYQMFDVSAPDKHMAHFGRFQRGKTIVCWLFRKSADGSCRQSRQAASAALA